MSWKLGRAAWSSSTRSSSSRIVSQFSSMWRTHGKRSSGKNVASPTSDRRPIQRSIGASALALADAGSAVAVADVREEQAAEVAGEIRARGGQALAVAMDVTHADAVSAAAARAREALGPIEVLVNCAGWDEFRPFLATDEAFWRRVIAINYEGCLRTTAAVIGGMAELGWGRIVNVSSDAARVGSAQEAVYAGAKAGVIAFTKTIAREFARQGITANAVWPGPTDTEHMRDRARYAPEFARPQGA